MVMFYDEYSTETFTTIVNKYLDAEFVQPVAAQIEDMFKVQINQRNSPLLNYPVADSTLSTIINHTKKLLHTDLHLLVRIAQLITLGEWLILLDGEITTLIKQRQG